MPVKTKRAEIIPARLPKREESSPVRTTLLRRRQAPDQGHRIGRRPRREDRIVGGACDAVRHISGQEAEGVAGRVGRDGVDGDLAERRRCAIVLIVPPERRIAGLIALLPENGDEIDRMTITKPNSPKDSNLSQKPAGR